MKAFNALGALSAASTGVKDMKEPGIMYLFSQAVEASPDADGLKKVEKAMGAVTGVIHWPMKGNFTRERMIGMLCVIRVNLSITSRRRGNSSIPNSQIFADLDLAEKYTSPNDASGWPYICVYRARMLLEFEPRTAEGTKEAIQRLESVSSSIHLTQDSVIIAEHSELLAEAHVSLGHGQDEQGIEKGIQDYESYLETDAGSVAQRARAQTLLAMLYSQRIKGDVEDNTNTAISLLKEASENLDVQQNPYEYAMAKQYLSHVLSAYRNQPDQYYKNLDLAIEANNEAIEVFSKDKDRYRTEYGDCMQHHAQLISERKDIREDTLDIIEHAGNEAQKAFSTNKESLDYSRVAQTTEAARAKIGGDDPQKSLFLAEQTLKSCSKTSEPLQWAAAQTELAKCYLNLPRNKDGAANILRAINLLEDALECLPKGDSRTLEWMIRSTIADAHAVRLDGNTWENLEYSIQEQSGILEEFDYSAEPQLWTNIACNLAQSYMERTEGDFADNIELAISYLEEAATFTGEHDGIRLHIHVQSLLSDALFKRIRGNKTSNLKNALDCARSALSSMAEIQAPDPFTALLEQRIIRSLESFGIEVEDFEFSTTDDDRYAVPQSIRTYINTLDADEFPEKVASAKRATAEWLLFITPNPSMDMRSWQLIRHSQYERALCDINHALELAEEHGMARKIPSLLKIKAQALSQLYEVTVTSSQPFDSDDIDEIFSLEAPVDNDKANDHIKQAIPCQERLLEIKPKSSGLLEYISNKFDLGKLYLDLRHWDKVSEIFLELNELLNQTIDDAIICPSNRDELIDRLALSTRYAAMALSMKGEWEDAVYTTEIGRGRLRAKKLSLIKAAQTEEKRNKLRELESELDSHESYLSSDSLIDRMTPLRNSLKIRRRINELLRSFKEPEQISKEEVIHRLDSIVKEDTVFLIPLASFEIGTTIICSKQKDTLQFSSFSSGGELKQTNAYMYFTEWLKAYEKRDNETHVDSSELSELFGEVFYKDFIGWYLQTNKRGITNIIFMPTNAMATLPINMSRVDEEGILESHSISICNALTQVNRWPDKEQKKPRSNKIGSVSNPETVYNDLPLAEIESYAAGKFFRDSSATSGREANLSSTIDTLEGKDFWHFACHCRFNIKSPERSELILANKESLTMTDILRYPWKNAPALVVLSACDSAKFDQRQPSEFNGLVSAFQDIGAKGVIASLWKVDDMAGCLLITKFFEEFASDTLGAPQALRRAQVWLANADKEEIEDQLSEWLKRGIILNNHHNTLKERLDRRSQEPDYPFADPYFWSGFVHYGN